MAGIYIHIPFCKQRCSYCDFHFVTQTKNKALIVDSLIKEIGLRSSETNDKIDSIYFGGGTPSILTVAELISVFNVIKEKFEINKDAEITIEVNPDDIEEKWVEELKNKTPINRFSVGVQSFHNEDLIFMNRAHNQNQAINGIKILQDFDFTNYSLDLIHGIPNTDFSKLLENISLTVSLKPKHISVYALEVEEKTLLNYQVKNGFVKEVEDEHQEAEYRLIYSELAKAGFHHYEISSFSKAGYKSKHNSSYWNRIPYLGFGPSAHSFDGKSKRSWNVSNNAIYIKKIASGILPSESEVLDKDEVFNEILLTGLRTEKGVEKNLIVELCGESYLEKLKEKVKNNSKLIENIDSFYLNEIDWFLADAISRDVMYV